MDIPREQITAGILAGGEGRRLGGLDKGWYELAGRALVEHVLERVGPQCGAVVISANRSLARYRGLNLPVQRDDDDDYRGPLAGIAAILRAARTPYVLTVPVDTPLLPVDLADRLASAMRPSTQLARAHADSRDQPLHALMRRDVLAELETALFAGVRAVTEWQARLDCQSVAWEEPEAFANLNRPEDAQAMARLVARR
ncbi:molybdenum cofactor guanylyltransferase MobA [Salinisphaera sp. T31B1]|uniref:molybdenum cofactor guanylyltransferase MobA n=1 Tax=Salinisphaera sp. T31B1 TaxID=727963 RepID=UPI00333E37EB